MLVYIVTMAAWVRGAEAEGLVLEGRAMDREQAVAYALEAVATPT